MLKIPPGNTISVLCSQQDDSEVTIARFFWPIMQPNETYTIALGRTVSIALDLHIPVRPERVLWRHDNSEIGAEGQLEKYFGSELLSSMEIARDIGWCAVDLSLSPEQRRNIAALQEEDPSTPDALRRGCHAMLQSESHHQD